MSQDFEALARIKEKFPEAILDHHSFRGDETVIISRQWLVEVMRLLKEEPGLDYNMLIDLAGVDYLGRVPRFEVVYNLYSLGRNRRLRIKVQVPEEEPEVDSLTELWPIANWFEREVWDMFGVRFQGHPDLRRILMYDEFEGHPLRRDYPLQKRQPLIGPRL